MSDLLAQGFCIGSEFISALAMSMLILTILVWGKMSLAENKLFLALCISQLTTLVLDMFYRNYLGSPGHYGFVKTSVVLIYLFVNINLGIFTFYMIYALRKKAFISNTVGYVVVFILFSASIVLASSIIFDTGWFYSITPGAVVNSSPYVWIAFVVPAVLLLFDVMLAWSCQEVLSFSEAVIWAVYIVFPVVGLILSKDIGTGAIHSFFAGAILFVFLFEHTQKEKVYLETETELAESKLKLTVSQIQPHFMYNSLNSIYYLIEQDPETAQEAVSDFSDYLRQNINALKTDKAVEFAEELAHVDTYLSLEKLRFGDKLKIEKDITCKNFKVPALSVQPLAENAVKHGISKSEKGGTLKISTREDELHYIICVEDDGVGFNPSANTDDKHTHVGLSNVQSRLEAMCKGKLSVEGREGQGTNVTIILPKEVQSKL